MDKQVATILVVDDDESAQAFLVEALSDLGTVVTASSIEQALSLIGQADILITDWNLGGRTAMPLIRDWQARGPCCVVSGMANDSILLNLRGYGVDDTLCKPFSADTLRRIVEGYVVRIMQKG